MIQLMVFNESKIYGNRDINNVHGNMEIQEIKRKNRNHVKDIRGKEKK
jgi:hypothetical protein